MSNIDKIKYENLILESRLFSDFKVILYENMKSEFFSLHLSESNMKRKNWFQRYFISFWFIMKNWFMNYHSIIICLSSFKIIKLLHFESLGKVSRIFCSWNKGKDWSINNFKNFKTWTNMLATPPHNYLLQGVNKQGGGFYLFPKRQFSITWCIIHNYKKARKSCIYYLDINFCLHEKNMFKITPSKHFLHWDEWGNWLP